MANLLSSLLSSSNALNAYEQVLAVTQNNVANASTPGYAKQTLPLEAMSFDLVSGSMGGVRAGQVLSARDQYAEQAVRQQTASQGYSQQSVNSLQSLQSLFDVSGSSGISAALNQLFQSFSAWGQNPSDTDARQTVIDNAGDVATAFQHTASGLASLEHDTEGQLRQTVSQVNSLVGQLQQINVDRRGTATADPGTDARLNSLLEQLSQYINFDASYQSDGSVAILLNGRTPLLLGAQQYSLAYQPAQGPPAAQILAADGTDVTAASAGGQLGALLQMRNQILPSYLGDPSQPGDLNLMAQQFAGRVNQLLASGVIADGITPGAALFQYDSTNPANAAASLQVDSTVTPDQLAATVPGPPPVSNGIPLALSQLATPQADADRIDGESFSAFYGAMAARAGSALNNANGQLETSQSALAQAQQLRQQISGVSLDEEATTLIQFQRAYEANSRLITVLDQLTQDTINILTT